MMVINRFNTPQQAYQIIKKLENIKKGYEKSSNLKGINYTWAKDEWGDVEKGNSKKVLFVKKNEYIFRLYFKVQLKL